MALEKDFADLLGRLTRIEQTVGSRAPSLADFLPWGSAWNAWRQPSQMPFPFQMPFQFPFQMPFQFPFQMPFPFSLLFPFASPPPQPSPPAWPFPWKFPWPEGWGFDFTKLTKVQLELAREMIKIERTRLDVFEKLLDQQIRDLAK